MTAPAGARVFDLPRTLPHVNRAGQLIGNTFGLTSILGWRASARDPLGHPAGAALDFMCTPDQGDRIAAFCLANAEGLGIKYVIWQQRYREPGGEWEPMEDRGSPTQNHMDHVHGQFTLTAGTNVLADPTGTDSGATPVDTAGWADGALSIAVQLAATIAAGALLVVGLNRTVSTGKD